MKNFKTLLLFILITVFCLSTRGQNQIDSLEFQRMFDLIEDLSYSNTDSAISVGNQTLEFAIAAEDQFNKAYSLYYLGGLYDIQGLYEKAYIHYFDALQIFEEIGEKRGIGGCLNCIGIVLWEQSELASDSVKKEKLHKSLDYTDKALSYYLDINYKKGIAVCYMNKGIVYDDYSFLADNIDLGNERREKSIENYEKALKIFDELEDYRSTADCYLNIASMYFQIFTEKGEINKKQYDLVIEYCNNALKLYEESNDLYGISMGLNNIAQIKIEYYKSNKTNKTNLFSAIDDAKKSLLFADSISALFLKYDAYFTLFNANKLLNKYKDALYYHELYSATKDSVHQTEQLEVIEKMETMYNVEQKEQKIKFQKIEIQQANYKNTIQKYILIGVIFFTILVIILLLNLFRLNKQKRKANLELKDKNLQLQNLNSTQNRLMSIISHDLKAPLSAFYSITNSLKTKFDKIERQEIDKYFDRMLNSSVALKLQLENMLNWAINQSRKINVDKKHTNLHIVVFKVVMILQEFAKEKNIILENKIDENLEIETDGKLLSIVFNNLISNAIKFSNKGGKIIISSEKKSKKIILSVKDFGAGISKADVENLFSNQNKITQKENSGTGLGLIVSKDIVEKLGGKIWVESELNIGTEFFVEL